MTRDITLESAKRRINAIKDFYHHLGKFILASAVLLSLKQNIVEWVLEHGGNTDPNFLQWVDWNILAVPIIWGIVIAVQGYAVFGYPLIKNWEERQVQKYLKEDESRKTIN